MARIVDRLLLIVYSLAVLAVSCYALAVLFGWIPYMQIGNIRDVYDNWGIAAIWISSLTLFLLISIRFLYISLRRNRGQIPSIDQRTEFGEIRISLETVENLSLKAAKRVRGVHDLKSRIKVNSTGLEIVIRTIVDGETSIPEMTEEIQSSIKSYIEEITGIPVANVTVFVANIAQSSATFKSRVE